MDSEQSPSAATKSKRKEVELHIQHKWAGLPAPSSLAKYPLSQHIVGLN